ncbi:PREDICTED: uncharacterized protein At4g06744-like [Nelumbo nucifera]|uniref:Uncharacterized protein At4g06744-like n=1 Tax=Nelumbo nucifera TaxID=4432 RepID=A0A1U8A9Q4_NELNU|nr:PREDICTED: uncharacterized protein At4g06744-like [Nelumbo nucifera]
MERKGKPRKKQVSGSMMVNIIVSFSATKFPAPLTLFIFLSCFLHLQVLADTSPTARETLDVTIGGGGYYQYPPPPPETKYSPPPPPPPPEPKYPPPPPAFESERLKLVYPYIVELRKRLEYHDPKGKLKSWKGTNICKFEGLYCETVPDFKVKALAGIDFNGFNFGLGSNVSLEGIIENLSDLAIFHANSNFFTGKIVSQIGKLRFLYELDLSNNKYTGSFPMPVLNAKNLSFLDLRFNSFCGYLPPDVFTLNLDVLFVNNNQFDGPIPYNLGSTPARYITFAHNRFSGSIPRSIGKAAGTLTEVLFLNNQLSGCLPYEIGLLKKATVFDAGNNHLTGPIPYSFGCLKRMQLLSFAGNKLYGQVPEVVCALPKLANLSLSDNYFTQVGPKCRHLIKKGRLHLENNCILDLKSQRSPAECEKFFSSSMEYCSYEKTFNVIPCKLRHHSKKASSTPPSAPAVSPSPSYKALLRHRL